MRKALDEPFGLTKFQRDALLIIQELSKGGIPPSARELRTELGVTGMSRTYEALKALHARGYIDWLPGRTRSVRILHRIEMPEEPEFVGFFEDEEKVKEFKALGVR